MLFIAKHCIFAIFFEDLLAVEYVTIPSGF